ncbi:MAG: hypothetical protein NT157_05445 [Candidatus Micrarchaeota archaeon]|nr:hypothetical protein [Candidatus Micrarchaeota archaeon]
MARELTANEKSFILSLVCPQEKDGGASGRAAKPNFSRIKKRLLGRGIVSYFPHFNPLKFEEFKILNIVWLEYKNPRSRRSVMRAIRKLNVHVPHLFRYQSKDFACGFLMSRSYSEANEQRALFLEMKPYAMRVEWRMMPVSDLRIAFFSHESVPYLLGVPMKKCKQVVGEYCPEAISGTERRALLELMANPEKSLSTKARNLGMTPSNLARIRKTLLARGILLPEIKVRIHNLPGVNFVVLCLLDCGCRIKLCRHILSVAREFPEVDMVVSSGDVCFLLAYFKDYGRAEDFRIRTMGCEKMGAIYWKAITVLDFTLDTMVCELLGGPPYSKKVQIRGL